MKDLEFEQKRTLSRTEVADQLDALAAALRRGGQAELDLGPGKLTLRIPDELRTEIEVELEDGEIELEIELSWRTGQPERAPDDAGG
ncbi:amphi-Trp domain-containing protein [Streptomyces sp. SP17BM10]|uniref:amphi-Trp domain-containing protein n=1 Tax=Streptomyces sp. SP17BM10 TaxID=3002530 RepID=UPI002E78BADB|nr:amphi-Trp domain-containing protein [Streptomyces sp. SP17BM10]MEE1788821.1 amphi-Trp domain-containing protein [Streptomyces sp. SP17BM10]